MISELLSGNNFLTPVDSVHKPSTVCYCCRALPRENQKTNKKELLCDDDRRNKNTFDHRCWYEFEIFFFCNIYSDINVSYTLRRYIYIFLME